jgi:uncharacterized membrane protein SpoIIM required for sporulation
LHSVALAAMESTMIRLNRFVLIAVGVWFVFGCSTGNLNNHNDAEKERSEVQRVVESMINDRSQWVDPAQF